MLRIFCKHFINSNLSHKNKIAVNFFLIVILTVSAFISWNYFGILFLLNGIFLFYTLKKYLHKGFLKYMTNVLIFIITWMFGAFFWVFEIENGFFAMLITIFLTTLPFCLMFIINKKFKYLNILTFIPIWLLYEAFNNFTSLSFPWITMGNVFSTNVFLVQWYKFTGVLGGTLWFLLLSYSLLKLIYILNHKKILQLILVFICPIFINYGFTNANEKSKNDSFLINKTFVTFNNERIYKTLNKDELAFYIFNKTKTVDGNYKVLLIPEMTFRGENLDNYKFSNVYKFLKNIVDKNNFNEVYYGSTIFKSKTYIANSSFFLSKNQNYIKSKKKLVIYNEYVPKFISEKLYKKKFNPNAYDNSDEIIKNTGVIPLICYEAFYSYFVLNKNNNAEIIYLISSEMFFNNSKFGKKQYNNFLKLRCIENGIPMIKASNSGETLVINSNGKIIFRSQKEINVFNFKS